MWNQIYGIGGSIMPFCGKCGEKVNESATFCPKCGNKIKNRALSEVMHTSPASSPKEYSLFSRKKIIAGVAILVAILIIVFIIVRVSDASPEKLIEGRWVFEDDRSMGFEFLPNGEMKVFYGTESIGGPTWSISGDKLEIFNLMSYEHLEIEVDFSALEDGVLTLTAYGDELVLYRDE